MKMKWMCLFQALLACASIGLGATVENVRAQQRPRTKLVEVYYDLNAPEGGRYDVTLEVKSAQNAPAVTTLSGAVGQNVSPGRNRCIVWDAGADWPNHVESNFVATVTAVRKDEEPEPSAGMVRIPGGTNSGTDPDYGAYSLTVSTFYMDRTEVTYGHWKSVYNWAVNHGYSFDCAGSGKGNNHPVHSVNWYDCVKWCNAKSEMEGRSPAYTVNGAVYRTGQSSPACNLSGGGYRLPTIDEWEYAARGGLSGRRFPWGDTVSHAYANYYASTYSYESGTTSGCHPSYSNGGTPYTAPVGSFASNGYGLYDMAGNVWEWCNDVYTSGSSRLHPRWGLEQLRLRPPVRQQELEPPVPRRQRLRLPRRPALRIAFAPQVKQQRAKSHRPPRSGGERSERSIERAARKKTTA